MAKKSLACLLAVILCLSLFVMPAVSAEESGPDFADAVKTTLTTSVDGRELKVDVYEDVYVTNPTAVAGENGYAYDGKNYVDQGISIYVPENATADSAIYFMVNNSGWQADSYSGRNKVNYLGEMVRKGMGPNATQSEFTGYSSETDNIGAALARGMVLVSHGCRSRNDKPDADGKYVSHSPATMTDTKAAIRYLRYNADKLPAGDPEKIVITGTSGGGALSAVIAASGNSADFYPSLYDVGAAGIEKRGDGYVSTIRDDVLATVAYCPINDLREADQAYEFTYSEVRKALAAEGFEWKFNDQSVNDAVLAASPVLAAAYPEYVKSLDIGIGSAEALEENIIYLLNAELAESVEEFGLDSMLADLAGTGPNGSTTAKFNSGSEGWTDWWTIVDGVPQITSHEQYEAFLTFVAKNQDLKAAPAFSNVGLSIAQQNEDSLLGTEDYPYSPYEFYSWNNDAAAGNGAGKDDTGLDWDAFMATDAGAYLALQNKMASPIDYLTVDKDNADSAPYWYVRHGMRDRDTSFALQTVLAYALISNDDVDLSMMSFEFAWLKGHSGNYDVPEAFRWLDVVLGSAKVVPSPQTITVDGAAVNAQTYNIGGYNVMKLRDVATLLNGTESQFSVSYDEESNTVSILSGRAYTPVGGEMTVGEDLSATCVLSPQSLTVNGQEYPYVFSFNIGGYNYFRLRDLSALLGFDVEYEEGSNTAAIDSALNYELDLRKALEEGTAMGYLVTPKLDGETIAVNLITAPYVSRPNRAEDQLINIFIPGNATKDSPIIFIVNNGGWMMDSYPTDTVRSYGEYSTMDRRTGEMVTAIGGDYKSDGSDKIGTALKEGYVIVSYGCRSRGNGATEGLYLGHSPATMTDTKAAIRYLRFNADELPAGDPEKIVITGTSGGGALSTVIAASGNSADFYPSLYDVGAAGVVKNADGTYTSTIGDDVFAVIGYCPIDMNQGCAAYEWTFNQARKDLLAAGATRPDAKSDEEKAADRGNWRDYASVTDEEIEASSAELAAVYAAYLDSLGLKDENGETLTAENFAAHTAALMEKEIAESIQEIGAETMRADITANGRVNNGWLTINDDGSFTYDYAKHLVYLATYTTLKIPSAFSNLGMKTASQNEDNLFGTIEQEYSPFNPYSWNNDRTPGNGVGKDDTGLDWDAYMETEAGRYLALQIKMTSATAYLEENSADVAPYWYVRHGMDDRDNSFGKETEIYYAALNNDQIEDLSFEFAWLKPHSGDYDVQEAYAWLKSVLD